MSNFAANCFGVSVVVTFLFCAVAGMPWGCTPHVARAATQISESHSDITATEYDLAEAAFSGGARAVPQTSGYTDFECQELLDRRDALLIATATLGTLSGVGGIATLIPKDTTPDERKRWDLGIGLSTLLCGATASTLTLAAQALSTRYERNCRTEKSAPAAAPDEGPVVVEHAASDELELAPSPFEGDGGVN
jgi:hypothetical protein